MVIDKSFLEKLEQMSAPVTFDIQGLDYSSKGLVLVTPPKADIIKVQSLRAVIDFCEKEMDGSQHLLHIEDHETVRLFGPIDNKYRKREQFLVATAFSHNMEFGRFYPVDEFIIALQAQFVQDETTAAILKLVGNMTRKSETATKDDGVTQSVEARVGLVKVENISVPNPVSLAPFRTFIEVGQPHSNFVLRLNSDHRCGLFEADGGAWMLEATKRVKEFLVNGLKSVGKFDQITILC